MQNSRVERLAYWIWQQRGMPQNSADEDWFLAERLLGAEREPVEPGAGLPLFAFGVERQTS